MNEYLIKPVKRDDLEQLLQKWLPIPTAVPAEQIYEEHVTRPLSVSELRQMMAVELPRHRQAIRQKLETDDYEAIYDIAHKIAGGSIYCELPKLEAAALALQNAARQKDPASTQQSAQTLLHVIDQTLTGLG
jgi:HPt (histidine-containing phosphotransfer) domain-containing protein